MLWFSFPVGPRKVIYMFFFFVLSGYVFGQNYPEHTPLHSLFLESAEAKYSKCCGCFCVNYHSLCRFHFTMLRQEKQLNATWTTKKKILWC